MDAARQTDCSFRTASAVLALAAAAVLLTGCGSGSPAPTPPATTAGVGSSASDSAGAASASATGRTVHVKFAAGMVSGDTGKVQVAIGSVVSLVVSSDVADEVHLHGYDKSVDVPAGGTATLRFTADIPGGFEVELEKLSQHLLELQVS